jgi:hypothetical protein
MKMGNVERENIENTKISNDAYIVTREKESGLLCQWH